MPEMFQINYRLQENVVLLINSN